MPVNLLKAKKHLGQNFLKDLRIQQRIIQACGLSPDDVVVEIGPGQGVLSTLIAPYVKKLICVEMDRDLIAPLRDQIPDAQIIHADFLKWNMSDLPTGIKVIGNIPYYISTPIIEKLIDEKSKIAEAFLTVQLEFGERLTAKAGGKDYGSLTCFARYHADIKVLFKIKNTCFRPVPKVDSCFLHLTMRPYPQQARDEKFLFKLIQTAFQQRRKTIVNALKGLIEKEKLEQSLEDLGIKTSARPETLTLSNYIELEHRLVL